MALFILLFLSYAELQICLYLVKVMKDSAVSMSSPPSSLRSIMKGQEQQPNSASPPAQVPEKPVSSVNATENGNNPESGGVWLFIMLAGFLMLNFQFIFQVCTCGY